MVFEEGVPRGTWYPLLKWYLRRGYHDLPSMIHLRKKMAEHPPPLRKISMSFERKITMAELPNVIPSALVHVINTLESDCTYRFQWKLTRNLENVSLFVKFILPAKSVTHDKVVPGSFPVKSAGKKSLGKRRRHQHWDAQQTDLNASRKRRLLNKLPCLKALPQKSSVPSERNRKPSLCLPRTVVTKSFMA